jgi:hypothetical protein
MASATALSVYDLGVRSEWLEDVAVQDGVELPARTITRNTHESL